MSDCVTNDLPDIRSCTIHREHLDTCDGWEYKWTGETTATALWSATGRECPGCHPRSAEHGYLCWQCWQDVLDAENAYWPLVGLLEEFDRLVTADNGGIRSASAASIPIPAAGLAVDEMRSFRRRYRGNLTAWVQDYEGAADAVRFARAVKGAVRSFPYEEVEHKVTRTRCTACQQLTLVWKPPRFVADIVQVACLNPDCLSPDLDQTAFETVARQPTFLREAA